jgi:hypothetical protein
LLGASTSKSSAGGPGRLVPAPYPGGSLPEAPGRVSADSKPQFARVANLADRSTERQRIRRVEKVTPKLKGKRRSRIDPEARDFPAGEERPEEVAPGVAGAPGRRHRGCEPQPGASLDPPGIDGPGALRFRLLGRDPQEALVDQAAAKDKFALVGQAPGNLPRAERYGPRGKPERRPNEAREEDLLPVK